MNPHAYEHHGSASLQGLRNRHFIRLGEVMRRTGMKRAGVYDAINRGLFPKPVRIGPRSVAWIEDEIDAWQGERIAARDAA